MQVVRRGRTPCCKSLQTKSMKRRQLIDVREKRHGSGWALSSSPLHRISPRGKPKLKHHDLRLPRRLSTNLLDIYQTEQSSSWQCGNNKPANTARDLSRATQRSDARRRRRAGSFWADRQDGPRGSGRKGRRRRTDSATLSKLSEGSQCRSGGKVGDMAEKVEARAIFEHASRFHYATSLLRIEFQQLAAPTIEPYMVVSSFCSGLYIRCLYAIQTDGKRIQGHDLKRLFDALSPDIRKQLSANWQTVANIYNKAYEATGEPFRVPSDLTNQLDLSGRMFKKMRYFYEGGEFAKLWVLSPLPDLIRSMILALHPEWGEGSLLIPMTQSLDGDSAEAPVGRWSFISYGIPRPPASPKRRRF